MLVVAKLRDVVGVVAVVPELVPEEGPEPPPPLNDDNSMDEEDVAPLHILFFTGQLVDDENSVAIIIDDERPAFFTVRATAAVAAVVETEKIDMDIMTVMVLTIVANFTILVICFISLVFSSFPTW